MTSPKENPAHRRFERNFELLRAFVVSNEFANRDQNTWNALLIAAALLSLCQELGERP